MFQLALACFVVGLIVFALWASSSVEPPSIGLPNWMAHLGTTLMVAGVIQALAGVFVR